MLFLGFSSLEAQPLYWDGGAVTTAYETAANWDTAADGTGGNPGAAPGAANTAVFNTSVLNGSVTIQISGGGRAAAGIIINNTGNTTFTGSTAGGRVFELGGGGLTINPGAGVVDFVPGSPGFNNPWRFNLTASQAWTNDSSNTLVHDNGNNDGIALGANVLTFAGSQGFTMQDTIVGTTGGIIVAMDASDDLVTFSNNNTYTGSTTINSGTLFANHANALGIGGNITFGGGILRYSAASAANDYSSRIKNSAGAIAIDTNGTTTTLGAIGNTNTGGLTKSGSGALSLTGANAYTGNTTMTRAGSILPTPIPVLSRSTPQAVSVGREAPRVPSLSAGATSASMPPPPPTASQPEISTFQAESNVLFDVPPRDRAQFEVISYTGNLTTDGTPGGSVSTDFTFGVPVSGRGGIVLDDSINKIITADLGYLLNTWTGSVNGVWDQNGAANWSNSNDSVFWNGDFVTFGDTGAGTVTLTNSGSDIAPTTITFSNTSGNDYTFNSDTTEALNQGGLSVTGSGNVTINSAIVGIGGINHSGTGTLAFTANNSYSGNTTISAGTLQLGNGGTTGSLATGSAITNNGTFVINRSNAVAQGTDFSGSAISGTGSFTQAGSGTTTLTANNTYTGATNINAGTLQIGSGGTTGTLGTGAVTNNGTLNFKRSNTYDVTNLISGTGGIITDQDGGTTALSGLNTFTGNVAIDSSSTLIVNSLANTGNAQSLGAGTGIVRIGRGGSIGTLSFNLASDSSTNRTIGLGTGNSGSNDSGGAIFLNNGVEPSRLPAISRGLLEPLPGNGDSMETIRATTSFPGTSLRVLEPELRALSKTEPASGS
ncbi:MAG: hypothetical protein HC901_02720 [Bdellovibrionaceae bacterium]|nr:hypothetical protein [Pseudobdellovibrionaceae bacterium]